MVCPQVAWELGPEELGGVRGPRELGPEEGVS